MHWHRGPSGDALAGGAGAALPLAFAPFGLAPLALISPALLFALWRAETPRRALWRGWLFGLGLFGVGVSWIEVSIYRFGGVSLAEALAITAVFVVILALFPALLGYLLTRVYPGDGLVKTVLVLPAGWVAFEWLRGWVFTGFPWLALGYSQIDTAIGGLAPLAGVYGVSWATILCATLLLHALAGSRGRRRAYPMLGLLALWGVSGLLGRVEWTDPEGPPIEVSLIQGNMAQGIKWLPSERRATIERYIHLTREHWGSRLIIWPETAIPAFYHQVQHGLVAALAEEARRHGTDVLVGAPVLDAQTERYYNSVVRLGEPAAFYHKRHLVPFTEYLPFKDLVGGVVDLLQVPMSDFSAGAATQSPLAVAGTRVGVSICFEAAFGEEIIRSLPQARLLVNVSNDAWFGDSLAPYQHLQIARMRALETGRALLRATNTGITALIDHRGEVAAVAPQFQVAVLTGTVQPRAGMTPYARAGNLPVVLGVWAVLGLAAWRRSAAQHPRPAWAAAREPTRTR